jgi:hypothetical protein
MIEICPDLGRSDRAFVLNLNPQQIIDQERAPDLLVKQRLRTMKFALQKCIEFVGTRKGLSAVGLGALKFGSGDGHLPAQRFLVDQFLKDEHLEGAIANLGRQIFRNPVVLASIGKIAYSCAPGRRPSDGAIHTRHRL